MSPLQHYNWPNSLRTEPIDNLDKLMFLFCGKQAIGSLSFAPGMDYGDLNEGIESAEIDAEEAGDSDEPGADGSDKEHDHNAKLPDCLLYTSPSPRD